ncbi:MAG: SHOCT domain-containing protein [Streptosporangiaceae bacterium]
MFVRRRPLLRAAAVGGAAYVAGKRRAERSGLQPEQEAGQDAQGSDLESREPSTGATAAASGQAPMSDQLAQLSTLHQQGALTDDEFATAKSRLLGG